LVFTAKDEEALSAYEALVTDPSKFWALVANEAVVAVEALPVNAPTNVVDVTEDNPAIVVAEDPKEIEVEPTVIVLLARFAFVIPAVPDKFPLVRPDIDPPKVKFPVEVTVPLKVIPLTVPVPPTDVTPLFNTFNAVVAYEADVAEVAFVAFVAVAAKVANEAVVAVEALPVKAPINVVVVKALVVALYVNPVLSTLACVPVLFSTNTG